MLRAWYAVTVNRTSTEATLVFAYGDGAGEIRTIPAGSGTLTFYFSYMFTPWGYQEYTETATVARADLRVYAYSMTYHPPGG